MLRALSISQQFPSEYYPALGVMVQNAVRHLAERVELEVLSPRPYTLPLPGFPYGALARLPVRRDEGGYRVHRPKYLYLVPKPWFYPLAGPAMGRALVRYAAQLARPHVIHAHWSYPDGWAALALRERFACPLIVHARGTLERVVAQRSARFRALVARPLTAADAVIANSEALRLDCLALGVPEAKLHVIPNGVDLALFAPSDKLAAKRSLALPSDRLLALYCGNLRPVKGVDLLAEAIPKLRAAAPGLGFAVLGAGELEGALRRQLGGFLHDGSLVMPGALPQSDVARYMNAADLLILPSRSEARSNVIVEALACQTPVAAARVGGIPEVMRPEHGVLFEPGSADAIVAAVLGLVREPAQLAQLGAAGRRFVVEGNLTWGAHAARTVELYRSLTGTSSANLL
jgi:glycosyltransferase involved in cell wall biosynthesis